MIGATMLRKWRAAFLLLWLVLFRLVCAAEGVALVMATEGDIVRQTGGEQVQLPAFSWVQRGDVLFFSQGSKVRLLYAASARQEVWGGAGSLKVEDTMSRANGLERLQVKSLTLPVAAQIMKTPTLDTQGKIVVARVRSIPALDAVERLESEYRRLRMEAALDDLNPQLFLLAGLLEMRDVARLEQALADLQVSYPDNMEAKVIVALYQKALRNMR